MRETLWGIGQVSQEGQGALALAPFGRVFLIACPTAVSAREGGAAWLLVLRKGHGETLTHFTVCHVFARISTSFPQ